MVHACMVYTERAEMAVVSFGTSHASAVSTPRRWIFKTALEKEREKKKKKKEKKLFTLVESHACAVSLLESGEQRYIKAINNNNNSNIAESLSKRHGYKSARN